MGNYRYEKQEKEVPFTTKLSYEVGNEAFKNAVAILKAGHVAHSQNIPLNADGVVAYESAVNYLTDLSKNASIAFMMELSEGANPVLTGRTVLEKFASAQLDQETSQMTEYVIKQAAVLTSLFGFEAERLGVQNEMTEIEHLKVASCCSKQLATVAFVSGDNNNYQYFEKLSSYLDNVAITTFNKAVAEGIDVKDISKSAAVKETEDLTKEFFAFFARN